MLATFLHDVLIPIQKVHRVGVGPKEKLNSLCITEGQKNLKSPGKKTREIK